MQRQCFINKFGWWKWVDSRKAKMCYLCAGRGRTLVRTRPLVAGRERALYPPVAAAAGTGGAPRAKTEDKGPRPPGGDYSSCWAPTAPASSRNCSQYVQSILL